MRYRVAFAKRFQSDGNPSTIDPSAELDAYLADGVVADKQFVEQFEPEAQHSQEVLDEDDAFLGLASPEVWEYDVVDDRAEEFVGAIQNSGTVMEFSVIDETSTEADEATSVQLADSSSRAPDDIDLDRDGSLSGSGRRGGDDGSVGQVTGDASAGGLAAARTSQANDEVEGIASEGAGSLDDLNIVDASDPSLGLTNYSDGPDDWAADTGPTKNPGRGVTAGGDR